MESGHDLFVTGGRSLDRPKLPNDFPFNSALYFRAKGSFDFVSTTAPVLIGEAVKDACDVDFFPRFGGPAMFPNISSFRRLDAGIIALRLRKRSVSADSVDTNRFENVGFGRRSGRSGRSGGNK